MRPAGLSSRSKNAPVPASDIPGEQAARTQAFTSLTPPLSPHRFALDQVWGITAADRDACRAAIAPLRNEGIFTPPSTRGTLLMPARIGGANWGRVAVDPVRQLAVIAVNRIAEMVQLIPRQGFDLQRARSEEKTRLGDDFEYNLMQGTPYVMRRRLLLAPSRLPCTPPPFGALVAIDLVTGLRKWEVPLGTMTSVLSPELAQQTKPDWGSVNIGGATATAGGVVFIGAALDRRLHAYDIETGRELWQGELPAGAKATPMTYRLGSGDGVRGCRGGRRRRLGHRRFRGGLPSSQPSELSSLPALRFSGSRLRPLAEAGSRRLTMTANNENDKMLVAFGEFVKAQRQLAQVSLRNLAKMSGVSDSYLSQIERGNYRPSPQVVKALAQAFGLKPEQLYTMLGFMDEERQDSHAERRAGDPARPAARAGAEGSADPRLPLVPRHHLSACTALTS